ncbi:MAG: YIP1 family protein [Paracoccus sp. (in: a-proteobacteria)]|uniref:YIP1 family protein n=1 Tax=Paracoccus sp. TaxID=267 RepID=UPI0026DECCAF|nr:YIP1 family protein [Paracoccus sp. (in: a-proteobacteria)]MDO5620364.1 YIP1 family protein [Paracoccus sp. (in: a-proteobacteria)]
MTLAENLRDLAVLTVRNPAMALRRLQALNLPMETRWMGLFLTVALSSILSWAASRLFPVEVDTLIARMTAQPLRLAAIQLVGMAGSAFLMARVGQLFGGRGSFADALLIVAWVELLLTGVQAVQVVLMLLFPAIATLLGVAAMIGFIYLAVQFTRALHGFRSVFLTMLCMFATLMLVGMALSMLAASFGLLPMPQGAV